MLKNETSARKAISIFVTEEKYMIHTQVLFQKL